MGTLRFILAVAVLMAHTGGYSMLGGQLAVQLFFAISGYLISFVLLERSAYGRVSRFFANRALRIFPLYLLVSIMALASHLLKFWLTGEDILVSTFISAPLGAQAAISITTLVLFGQDQVMFMATNEGKLIWPTTYLDSDIALHQALLVPQAWSLSLELMFYLMAPVVIRSRKLLFGLFASSLLLRAMLFASGLGGVDPWSYRWFPTELALFLLGAISHQIVAPLWERFPRNALYTVGAIFTMPLATLVVFFPNLPGNDAQKTVLLFVFFAAIAPLLGWQQRESRIDNYLGQLSYPIYVFHILISDVVREIYSWSDSLNFINQSLLVLVVTLLISAASNRLLDSRVDTLRNVIRGQ